MLCTFYYNNKNTKIKNFSLTLLKLNSYLPIWNPWLDKFKPVYGHSNGETWQQAFLHKHLWHEKACWFSPPQRGSNCSQKDYRGLKSTWSACYFCHQLVPAFVRTWGPQAKQGAPCDQLMLWSLQPSETRPTEAWHPEPQSEGELGHSWQLVYYPEALQIHQEVLSYPGVWSCQASSCPWNLICRSVSWVVGASLGGLRWAPDKAPPIQFPVSGGYIPDGLQSQHSCPLFSGRGPGTFSQVFPK